MRLHLVESLDSSPNNYMIEYLSGCGLKNYLFSYIFAVGKDQSKIKWSRIDALLDKIQANSIIIDSGAYSVFSRGETVSLDDYVNFCVKLQEMRQGKEEINFVNLDVIPGTPGTRNTKPSAEMLEESAQKGWDNFEYMTAKGLKVMHVYHQFEDWKWLEKIADSCEYFGIGAKTRPTERRFWYDEVFSRLNEMGVIGEKRIHGFGCTDKKIMYKYPLFSADSTSWRAPARYGTSMTQDLALTGLGSQHGLYVRLDTPKEILRWKQWERDITRLWEYRGLEWEGEDVRWGQ